MIARVRGDHVATIGYPRGNPSIDKCHAAFYFPELSFEFIAEPFNFLPV